MKIAVIHDWFKNIGGAEKVTQEILKLYPTADLFSLVDFLTDEQKKSMGFPTHIHTSFIQKMPFSRKKHESFLQLFPIAIEQFDLSDYDVIISSSHAAAKGVITTCEQLHICYCHTPMRYAWDMYHDYLSQNNLRSGLKSLYAKWVLHKMRIWDYSSSQRVDFFIANSHFISKRIKKTYHRASEVIYPPVALEKFTLNPAKKDFYVTASRLVSYKRVDLIIKAFNQQPQKKLYVIGSGSEMKKLKKIAGNNITFLGHLSGEEMVKYLQEAKAYIYAAKEDFGILPVEAQSCGTPVIAYGKGGIQETVIPNETGLFFEEQTPESLLKTLEVFENTIWDFEKIHQHAQKFKTENFRAKFSNFVEKCIEEWRNQ